MGLHGDAVTEELNIVILASARREAPSTLAVIGGESWCLPGCRPAGAVQRRHVM